MPHHPDFTADITGRLAAARRELADAMQQHEVARIRSADAAMIEILSDAMRETALVNDGTATDRELERLGFSTTELKSYAAKAARQAASADHRQAA